MKLRVIALIGMAAAAAQAGHLVTYELKFGVAAQSLQSSGVHAYFPILARTGLGIASAALIAGLIVVGMARVATGRRVVTEPAPPYLHLLARLFTLQLAIYSAQETVEALFGRTMFISASELLLWGAIGQLPVAAAAALALRWLFVRLRPAVAVIARIVRAGGHRRGIPPLVAAAVPVPAVQDVRPYAVALLVLSRRGPPSFVR